jgi:uncharacterized protein (TIGR03067 family)
MRLIGCATVLLLAGNLAGAEPVKMAAEQKRLEGQWVIAQRSYTPTGATAQLGKLLTDLGQKVEIKQDKLSATDPDKAGRYLFVQFDPRSKPKALNLKIPGNDNQVLLGIYRLENDLLSLVIGTGNVRPKLFGPFDHQVLLVLKRAPKKSLQPAAR